MHGRCAVCVCVCVTLRQTDCAVMRAETPTVFEVCLHVQTAVTCTNTDTR